MRAHIVKMQRSQTEMGRPDWMQPTLYDRSFKVASSTYKPDKYPIGGYPRKRSKARVPDLDTIMPATKAHTRSVDALSSRHQEALDAPTSSFASFDYPAVPVLMGPTQPILSPRSMSQNITSYGTPRAAQTTFEQDRRFWVNRLEASKSRLGAIRRRQRDGLGHPRRHDSTYALMSAEVASAACTTITAVHAASMAGTPARNLRPRCGSAAAALGSARQLTSSASAPSYMWNAPSSASTPSLTPSACKPANARTDAGGLSPPAAPAAASASQARPKKPAPLPSISRPAATEQPTHASATGPREAMDAPPLASITKESPAADPAHGASSGGIAPPVDVADALTHVDVSESAASAVVHATGADEAAEAAAKVEADEAAAAAKVQSLVRGHAARAEAAAEKAAAEKAATHVQSAYRGHVARVEVATSVAQTRAAEAAAAAKVQKFVRGHSARLELAAEAAQAAEAKAVDEAAEAMVAEEAAAAAAAEAKAAEEAAAAKAAEAKAAGAAAAAAAAEAKTVEEEAAAKAAEEAAAAKAAEAKAAEDEAAAKAAEAAAATAAAAIEAEQAATALAAATKAAEEEAKAQAEAEVATAAEDSPMTPEKRPTSARIIHEEAPRKTPISPMKMSMSAEDMNDFIRKKAEEKKRAETDAINAKLREAQERRERLAAEKEEVEKVKRAAETEAINEKLKAKRNSRPPSAPAEPAP